MKVFELLKARKKYDEGLDDISFHMNLLNCNVEELLDKFPNLKANIRNKYGNDYRSKKKEIMDDISDYVIDLFDKCNRLSQNYDEKVDEEITRLGLRTNIFIGHNTNIWNNGLFEDDNFGFGTQVTKDYDNYIDSQNKGKGL